MWIHTPKFTSDQLDALNALASEYLDLFSKDDSTPRLANHVEMAFSAALATHLDPEAPDD